MFSNSFQFSQLCPTLPKFPSIRIWGDMTKYCFHLGTLTFLISQDILTYPTYPNLSSN